jgi:selenoprotein W-related protein
MTARLRVEIEYCMRCRWLLRAAWTAQELLTTSEAELGEVAPQPGSGGVFEIRMDGRHSGLARRRAASPTRPSSMEKSGDPKVKEAACRMTSTIAPVSQSEAP